MTALAPSYHASGHRSLTDRQREALRFIGRSLQEVGRPPTLREIGHWMSIRSTNDVNDHLRALERKGYLVRTDDMARGIQLTHLGRAELGENVTTIGTAPVRLLPSVTYENVVGLAKQLPRQEIVRLQSELLALLLGDI